jgi:hypothetical protein
MHRKVNGSTAEALLREVCPHCQALHLLVLTFVVTT